MNQSAFGDEEKVRKLSFSVWRLNLSRKRKGIDGRSLRCSNGVRERGRELSLVEFRCKWARVTIGREGR
jgi:hypothetical protein